MVKQKELEYCVNFVITMKNFFRTDLFFFTILVTLVFIVYGKSINYEFTGLDDDAMTSNKSLYISNIKNFPNFFLTDCYHNKKVTQYYRPVLSLSFAIETILFGVNTKVYHLTNLILLILTFYLIYMLLSKFCNDKLILKFIILLFCVHPVFTSTAVWLPARNDSLLAVFVLLFLITYINYVNKNSIAYFMLSNIFFIVALFTKETTIILIPLLFLINYAFDIKFTKKHFFNYIFIVIPTLTIYFYLRYLSVAKINFDTYIENFIMYTKNIIYGLIEYIKYFFVVSDQPIMLSELKFDTIGFIITIIVVLLLIYVYCNRIVNRKVIVLSGLSFLFILLPTFMQEYYEWFSHRITIPIIFIIYILSELLNKLILKYSILKKYIVTMFVLLILVFSSFSFLQANKYSNKKMFWTNAYINVPNNYVVCRGLSDFYIENKEYDKAKYLALKAMKLSDNDVKDYIRVATIEYFIDGNLDIAESNYTDILNNLSTDDYYSRSNIYARLGEIYYLKGDLTKAIEYTQKSVDLLPYNKHNLVYLANYYSLNKQFDKSKPIYEMLLKYDENNEYYKYLLKTLEEDKKIQEQKI